MLTEAEVQRTFRQMVTKTADDAEVFGKAEALLEELRPESPLRHRLLNELEELRKLADSNG